MCIILNHEKTTFPIQDIFGDHFYIQGHLFNLGQIYVEKILTIFQGQIFVWGAIFLVWGNLKSLFLGQILFLGGFFQFGQFCVWEILNLYFGVKFL